MAADILALADRLWNGELSTANFHPVDHVGGFVEITDGVGFCPSFANDSAFATGDGLFLVDTGSAPLAKLVHDDITNTRLTGSFELVIDRGVLHLLPVEQQAAWVRSVSALTASGFSIITPCCGSFGVTIVDRGASWPVVFGGGLIQTAVGRVSGRGGPLTNRSG